ncbi:MAG: type IV pilus assembly protein PilM [Bacteriovoracaceae bacterium]|nr:type IV pilus assembly protein PilM [Bacteriovoracaceae bacterium]
MSLIDKNIINRFVYGIKDALKIGSSTIVGIDIGLSAVKVAEVVELKGGRYKLTKYSMIPLSEGALIEDEIQKEEEIIEAIREALVSGKISSKIASIAISGPNTVVRKLQLAGGSNDEIEDQVLWEAEQYLPFDIDSSTVSSHLFGENLGGGVDVLMVGAKDDVILRFKDLVEMSGVRVKVVDINAAAITNMFEHVLGDELLETESSKILMDIGAQKTTFIIYKSGILNFCKEINVGGSMITEEIQRQLGVNFEQAEDLKTTTDKGGNLPEEVLEVVDDVLEIFYKEIKKTVDFYITAMSDEDFSECWVTGGAMLTPNLVEGLESILKLPVKMFNPLDKIECDRGNFDDEMLDSINYCGVTAIGLAMRKFVK